jgi:hypothetical protein
MTSDKDTKEPAPTPAEISAALQRAQHQYAAYLELAAIAFSVQEPEHPETAPYDWSHPLTLVIRA